MGSKLMVMCLFSDHYNCLVMVFIVCGFGEIRVTLPGCGNLSNSKVSGRHNSTRHNDISDL